MTDSRGAYTELESAINAVWEQRDQLTDKTKLLGKKTVDEVLDLLGQGKIRVSEKTSGGWVVNEWAKKAILLSFRMNDSVVMGGGPAGSSWFDQGGAALQGMNEAAFKEAGFRAVPGCFVRASAYIAPKVVLMPSFINVGAYVAEGTMVDTWVTIGSCAQIGRNCHISGGVGIGGVLEPLQASPVVIEDNVFVGARSEVAEGRDRGGGQRAVDGRLPQRLHQDRRPRDGRDLHGPRACVLRRRAGDAAPENP